MLITDRAQKSYPVCTEPIRKTEIGREYARITANQPPCCYRKKCVIGVGPFVNICTTSGTVPRNFKTKTGYNKHNPA